VELVYTESDSIGTSDTLRRVTLMTTTSGSGVGNPDSVYDGMVEIYRSAEGPALKNTDIGQLREVLRPNGILILDAKEEALHMYLVRSLSIGLLRTEILKIDKGHICSGPSRNLRRVVGC
jgi:hypothetical protein